MLPQMIQKLSACALQNFKMLCLDTTVLHVCMINQFQIDKHNLCRLNYVV